MNAAATLAMSASLGAGSCALRTANGDLLFDNDQDGGLLAAVARLTSSAALAPAAIRHIHLDLGPGSYTGLRVAVTFARTLHEFAAVEVSVASSFELLALHAWTKLGVPTQSTIRVMLDAYRGRIYQAALRLGHVVEFCDPPTTLAPDEARGRCAPSDVLLVDGALQQRLGWPGITLPPADRHALVASLLDPRIEVRATDGSELEPLYLMGTYAD